MTKQPHSINVFVTDFETLILKPETKQRFDDLPSNWEKIISDKRYKSKESQEARRKANELHDEIKNASRDAFLAGASLGEY